MSEKNSESSRLHQSFEQAKEAFAKESKDSEHYLHRIKSFVLRTGRLTPGQARAIETLGPEFLL
ncbi:MAG: hypothetical protein RLZZ472_1009, partial [Pseudomonadota bacterium]